MNIIIDEKGGSKVAVITSDELLISDTQDALDLMATVRHLYDCDKLVIDKSAIIESFFDLKTRIAGDILQKFTTYQVKLAIVGDFSVYTSKSLRDFIYESNKGRQVNFLPDTETAINKLHSI